MSTKTTTATTTGSEKGEKICFLCYSESEEEFSESFISCQFVLFSKQRRKTSFKACFLFMSVFVEGF